MGKEGTPKSKRAKFYAPACHLSVLGQPELRVTSMRMPRAIIVFMFLLLDAGWGWSPPALAAPLFAPEVEITKEGSVHASTTSPGYPAELSIDGDPTTSWFSTGPEPNAVPTRYEWTHSRDDLITTVYLHGNGENATPDFRTGYGFGKVTVQVLDGGGNLVFEQKDIPLPGSPDPDVTVHPNVAGRTIVLLFSGHESPDCGGISELQVKADRTPLPPPPPPQVQATNAPPKPAPSPTQKAVAPGDVIVSDDFNRADADRCNLGAADNALGGDHKLYYLPIFPTNGNDATDPIGANLVSGAAQNNGNDFGGFQFALSPPCNVPIGTVRGTDLGQDLNIRAELLVPTNAAGLITQAGPYFRSRAAAYGDGIIGGASAGYWVQLLSTGEIVVKSLNPWAPIATSGKPASFDPGAIHTLEIAAGADQLQVALDGRLQTFNQNDQLITKVNIPSTSGANDGTVGIAFGAEQNRGQIGGQRADNVTVTAFKPLDGLPVQNNFASPTAAPTATAAPTGTSTLAATETSTPAATAAPTTPAAVTPQVALAPTLIPSNAAAGDCDNDGKLTELDALCALEMSTGLRVSSAQMDLDGDGTVSSRDAVIILQRAVSK